MSSWQLSRIRDISGGENKRVVPEQVGETQCLTANNCVITAEGALETRFGKVKVNTDSLGSGAIRAFWRWGTSNGTNYLTVIHGTVMYSTTWDGSSAITSWTTIKTGLNSTSTFRAVVWKDMLIVSDGIGNPFRFSGSTATDLSGTPPKTNIMTVYAGKLVVVDFANPNQIRFSGLESYDTWDALDVIVVRSNDGDTITALEAQDRGLLIYKQHSTWCLYGFDRFDWQLTTGPIAPTGAYSMGCVQTNLMLGTNNNFNVTSVNMITPQPDTHGSQLAQNAIGDLKACVSTFDIAGRRALFHVNGTVYCINGIAGGAVTSWTGLNVSAIGYAGNTGESGTVLIGDATNGFIYKLTGDNDNGTVITTGIKTAYRDWGTPQDKVWRSVRPDLYVVGAARSDVQYRYDVDYQLTLEQFSQATPTGFSVWGTGQWDVMEWGADVERYNKDCFFSSSARGEYLSLEITTPMRIKFLGFIARWRPIGNMR